MTPIFDALATESGLTWPPGTPEKAAEKPAKKAPEKALDKASEKPSKPAGSLPQKP